MTIADVREKCKSLVARVPRDILYMATLLLASSLSFGLGFFAGLDARQENNISIEATPYASTATAVEFPEQEGQVVASKSGTKYYFTHCSGAARISDANKVWFTSATTAEKAGYTLAVNCK